MRGYGQFCPVARASEILTERWTPLILRELLVGTRHFNDLRKGAPLMPRSLLAARLRQLEDAGVVRSHPKAKGRGREYQLTEAGEKVRPIIEQLAVWGDQWIKSPLRTDEMDLMLLMWDLPRGMELGGIGTVQVVVKFIFRGVPKEQRPLSTWWLIVNQKDVEVCISNPGHEVALTVRADLRTFVHFWMGRIGWSDAVKAGSIEVEGEREEGRLLAQCLGAKPPAGLRVPWYKAPELTGQTPKRKALVSG
jgi:DNA-binding HxlR family transcriptional regulator